MQGIVLVGHSYGGAVITGVAERIPERLTQLVYLDAHVLRDGEAVADLYDQEITDAITARVQALGDGWRFPPEDPDLDPRFTDHPFRTVEEPLQVQNPAAAALPHIYIYCTEKEEMGPAGQGIIRSAARVRAAGWEYYELPTGHHPMWTMPQELASLLGNFG